MRVAAAPARGLTVIFLLSLISDKMFPALGFGAQLPPDWKVSEAGLLAERGWECVFPGSASQSLASAQLPCL